MKKKVTKKNDLNKNIDQIKSSAKTLNNQILETAEVVVEQVRERGVKMGEEAIERVKETIENISIEKGVDVIKTTAKDVNSYSLKTADELIKTAVNNGEKWQEVAEKAINGGLTLVEKQQDIIFTTLESVKEQFQNGTSRFAKLFK